MLFLILNIIIAAWVYSNAKDRGVIERAWWGWGTLLLPFVYLPLYLIARPPITLPGSPASINGKRAFLIVIVPITLIIGTITCYEFVSLYEKVQYDQAVQKSKVDLEKAKHEQEAKFTKLTATEHIAEAKKAMAENYDPANGNWGDLEVAKKHLMAVSKIDPQYEEAGLLLTEVVDRDRERRAYMLKKEQKKY